MSAIISLFGLIRYRIPDKELLKAKEFATGSRLFSNRAALDDDLPLGEKLTRRRLMKQLNHDVNHICRRRIMTKKPNENPFERDALIQRIGGQRIRCSRQIHSSYNLKRSALREADYKDEIWSPVYRFHGIALYAFISRLKVLQTFSSVMLMPYCYYKYLNEEIGGPMLAMISCAAILAPIIFIIFTRYFNRIVGVIAINESRTIVRIGHLSPWGGRTNTYIPVENIVPLAESPYNPKHYFVKLQQYTKGDRDLIIATRKVEICDVESAHLIFGSINFFMDQGAFISDDGSNSRPVVTEDDDAASKSAVDEDERADTPPISDRDGGIVNEAFDDDKDQMQKRT